ncbi:MAG: hypothetical protein ACI88H_003784 [Cocleimonas sp.]|jgi:hypothetical protein
MIPAKSKWCSVAIERMLERNPDIQSYINSFTEKDASEIGLSLYQYKVSEELQHYSITAGSCSAKHTCI